MAVNIMGRQLKRKPTPVKSDDEQGSEDIDAPLPRMKLPTDDSPAVDTEGWAWPSPEPSFFGKGDSDELSKNDGQMEEQKSFLTLEDMLKESPCQTMSPPSAVRENHFLCLVLYG
jgi:hypothetical protein